MPAATARQLIDELETANDMYHCAFDEVLKSNCFAAAVKAKTGAYMNNIFQLMTEAHTYLENSLL